MPELWDHLQTMFEKNQLYSHELVYDEIVPSQGEKDELAKWIFGFKKYFLPKSQEQMDHLHEILREFPKLIDPESEKDQADPYLIAMLKIKKEEGLFGSNSDVLVSSESERSGIKLPAACKRYKIRHMSTLSFLEDNFNFSINRK